MTFRSRLSSKGQVTIPVEIRRKLGLKSSDRVEFRERGGEIIMAHANETESPFAKYDGILAKKVKRGFDPIQWQRELSR